VSDVYGALAELDLVLVPSVGAEATTRVILEAFAAGVPVIAFDCGGISEVVADGVTGVLTRSVEEMACESAALLKDHPERRMAMARAARAEWEGRFTKEKFHAQLLAAMEECGRTRGELGGGSG
jgi:glycosyltransferase involved in cell wall biosynthesis